MRFVVGISLIIIAVLIVAFVLWTFLNNMTDGEPESENLEEN